MPDFEVPGRLRGREWAVDLEVLGRSDNNLSSTVIAVLDTGTAITIVDSEILVGRDYRPTNPRRIIRNVWGEPIEVKEYIVKFRLGPVLWSGRVLALPNLSITANCGALIGMDIIAEAAVWAPSGEAPTLRFASNKIAR